MKRWILAAVAAVGMMFAFTVPTTTAEAAPHHHGHHHHHHHHHGHHWGHHHHWHYHQPYYRPYYYYPGPHLHWHRGPFHIHW